MVYYLIFAPPLGGWGAHFFTIKGRPAWVEGGPVINKK